MFKVRAQHTELACLRICAVHWLRYLDCWMEELRDNEEDKWRSEKCEMQKLWCLHGCKLRCLHERMTIVPMVFYALIKERRGESLGSLNERRRVNVLDIKCLKNMVGVTLMDMVWNEEG